MGQQPTKDDEGAEELAGKSACPTLRRKRGAGASACQIHDLRTSVFKGVTMGLRPTKITKTLT